MINVYFFLRKIENHSVVKQSIIKKSKGIFFLYIYLQILYDIIQLLLAFGTTNHVARNILYNIIPKFAFSV